MANPEVVKQSLTPPDFTDVAASKLADLLAKGYVITGYCFERQVEGTQPQRGFVDFAGFVGWWRSDEAAFEAGCRFIEQVFDVADMKGGQDVDA